MIVLCVLIYYGGNKSKWIYIIINSMNLFLLVYTFLFGEVVSKVKYFEVLLNIVTIIMLFISIVTSVILIFSSSVKDFMHRQKDSY